MKLPRQLKGCDADLLRAINNQVGSTLIRYQGALQQEDGAEYAILKGKPRGRIVEYTMRTDKQGEGGESKFKLALINYEITLIPPLENLILNQHITDTFLSI